MQANPPWKLLIRLNWNTFCSFSCALDLECDQISWNDQIRCVFPEFISQGIIYDLCFWNIRNASFKVTDRQMTDFWRKNACLKMSGRVRLGTFSHQESALKFPNRFIRTFWFQNWNGERLHRSGHIWCWPKWNICTYMVS